MASAGQTVEANEILLPWALGRDHVRPIPLVPGLP